MQDESNEHVSMIQFIKYWESSKDKKETKGDQSRTTTIVVTGMQTNFVGNVIDRVIRRGIVSFGIKKMIWTTKRLRTRAIL